MAIKDTSRKPYIEDNDTNIFIGLDLPLRKSEGKEGFFASTKTTLEAVKNNIRNLLQTSEGERIFQPQLGLDLKRYLFNQINEETIFNIQNEIVDKFELWLSFVEIKNIEVKTHDDDINIGLNTISINVIFNIEQDPNTLSSVQVNINDENSVS